MPASRKTAGVLLALALGAIVLAPAPAAAAQAPRPVPPSAPAPPTPPTVIVGDEDARQTREQFAALLEKYPPSLGRVLKLDPSLLGNQAYLAPYPALINFLNQHPGVIRNSPYFLESVYGGPSASVPESSAERMWSRMVDGLGFILVFGTFASLFAWLVKTLVDYRRWQKLAKVQTDAHTKLLDRFTANDELIAYVQSPAGSQFLQSAPISLDPGARRLGAPFSRILWSVQAGLVLAMGGLGLQYVSSRVDPDAAQPLFAMGVLALALGAGFVLSAGVAYFLSHRLGLFEPPAKLPLTGRSPNETHGA